MEISVKRHGGGADENTAANTALKAASDKP